MTGVTSRLAAAAAPLKISLAINVRDASTAVAAWLE
jgi:hypothetical protein